MFSFYTIFKIIFYIFLLYVAWLIIKRALWTSMVLAIGIFLGFQLSYEIEKIKKKFLGEKK